MNARGKLAALGLAVAAAVVAGCPAPPSEPDHGPLYILSPDGGEVWHTGDAVSVQWNSDTALPEGVRLELVGPCGTTRPLSMWRPCVAGQNCFTWSVPQTMRPCRDYRLRIQARDLPDAVDVSDAPFVIRARGPRAWNRLLDAGLRTVAEPLQGGGWVVAGGGDTLAPLGVTLSRIDEDGLRVWRLALDGGAALGIAERPDGTLLCATASNGYPVASIRLYCVDPQGSLVWTRSYVTGNRWFEGFTGTADGGCALLAGPQNNTDSLLLKADALGQLEWSRPSVRATNRNLEQTSDGGYIITGYRLGALIKTNKAGELEWERSSPTGLSYAVHQMPDEGFLLLGESEDTGNLVWIRTDPLGQELWRREWTPVSQLPGSPTVYILTATFTVTPAGDPVAALTTSQSYWENQAVLVKFTPKGEETWSRYFLGRGRGDIGSVHRTADDGYLFAGATGSFGWPLGTYAYVLKTDCDGYGPSVPTPIGGAAAERVDP